MSGMHRRDKEHVWSGLQVVISGLHVVRRKYSYVENFPVNRDSPTCTSEFYCTFSNPLLVFFYPDGTFKLASVPNLALNT